MLIAEADSAAEYFKALNMWRIEGTEFFKSTKTAPALPVQEAMATAEEMLTGGAG